jgi:hypothetical protein
MLRMQRWGPVREAVLLTEDMFQIYAGELPKVEHEGQANSQQFREKLWME